MEFKFCSAIKLNNPTQLVCVDYDWTLFELAEVDAIVESYNSFLQFFYNIETWLKNLSFFSYRHFPMMCTYGNECTKRHDVMHNTFASITWGVELHMGCEQLCVLPFITLNFCCFVNINISKVKGLHLNQCYHILHKHSQLY
jgi:hypothetical protein